MLTLCSEDEGQSVSVPGVATKAADAADGDRLIDADEGQVVVDTVAYENLTPGESYTLKGRVLDAETGDVLAEATTEFTPEEADGEAKVEFTVDGTGLEGKRLYCAEHLYRGEKLVGSHDDADDEGQSVRLPGIHTTATDAADGDHEAEAAATVKIVDRVEYTGLVAGREYTVAGHLVDRETGEPVEAAGAEVYKEVAFTAETSDGHVDVEFEFDGSLLAGHDLVAFEEITHEGRKVAVHADLRTRSRP